ncbi:MAG: hypothetical protein WHS86_05400 [Desulfosoma sp.]
MGNDGFLSCLEKRELLNRTAVSVDELRARAKALEEAGLIHDAVDFYEKAQAWSEIERLIPLAVEEGDAFLFARLFRVLKKDPSPEQWRALAARAEALGKRLYAQRALQQVS